MVFVASRGGVVSSPLRDYILPQSRKISCEGRDSFHRTLFGVSVKKTVDLTSSELDQLDEDGKKRYIQEFKEETGFPDLAQVSRNIEQHAEQILLQAENELNRKGAKIVCSYYAKPCSVGRGRALPGSDLDSWVILLRGDEQQAEQLASKIEELANPRLLRVLPEDWAERPFLVVLEDTVRELGNYPNVPQMKSLLNEQGLFNYEGEWIDPFKVMNLSWTDRFLQNTPQVALLLSVIKNGNCILDRRSQEHVWLQGLNLYHRTDVLEEYFDHFKNEGDSKHAARENLGKIFDGLSVQEQFAIVRILDRHTRQISFNLSISPQNPYLKDLQSLEEKGFLRRTNDYFEPTFIK